MSGVPVSVRLGCLVEFQEGRECLLIFLSPLGGRKESPQCRLALLFVPAAKGLLVLGRGSSLLFPLPLLLTLLMGVQPIRRGAGVLHAVNEERCGRRTKAGKSSRILVHGGVGDPHPSLNEVAGVFFQKPADARSIDADLA